MISLISGDWHIPHHDSQVMSLLVQAAELLKPHRVVLLGDLLDAAAFSSFDGTPAGGLGSFSREAEITMSFMEQISRHCRERFFLEGNHEHRVFSRALEDRMMRAAVGMLTAKTLADRLGFQFVEYGGTHAPRWIRVGSIIACHGWRHGANASERMLADLAPVLGDAQVVVHGHTHRLTATFISIATPEGSPRGLHLISAGTCSKPQEWYTARPGQCGQGFAVVLEDRRNVYAFTVPVVRSGRKATAYLPLVGEFLVA